MIIFICNFKKEHNMKYYEISSIAFLLIGLSVLIAGYIAKNVFDYTPEQTTELKETILKDGLAIANAE